MAVAGAGGNEAIANVQTTINARVDATLTVAPRDLDALLARTRPAAAVVTLPARIGAARIDLVTDNLHLATFWRANWPAASTDAPADAVLRAMPVPDLAPHAYFCPDRAEALLANTDYYGQCKSWALGLAAVVLQHRSGVHSIHGASLELRGRGVVIVGGTGSGKSTQVARLCKAHGARLIGDDWTFVRTGANGFTISQPETMLYIRTDNAATDPELASRLRGALLENVVTTKGACTSPTCRAGACMLERGDPYCLWGHPNARALVPREWLAGPAGLADEARLGLLVVLHRDARDANRTASDPATVVDVLRRGPSEVRPGGDPPETWGTMTGTPYYNPYLLAPDHAAQDAAFAAEARAGALLVNTAYLGVDETAYTIARATTPAPAGF